MGANGCWFELMLASVLVATNVQGCGQVAAQAGFGAGEATAHRGQRNARPCGSSRT
jgi:hypothetical protein